VGAGERTGLKPLLDAAGAARPDRPAPPKRRTKRRAVPAKASHGAADASSGNTPLHIPFGNKEAAQRLGARYGDQGWCAPPGTDLGPFRARGWL
jgi:DNA topoisomerase-3